MHTKLLIILGIASLASSTSSRAAEMVLRDITVTPSTEWGNTQVSAENLVNNSGLFTADDTSVPAIYDLTAVHNFSSNAADQWHTNTGDTEPTLTFDLGGAYDLTGIHIWNGNQGGDASNADRGVQQFDLLISTDGGNNYTEILTDAILAQGTGNSFIAAQSFDLTGSEGVTHIFMRIDSNFGNDYTGLAEVMITAVRDPFIYDPNMTADFALDFGTGEGKDDELSLLRNQADHFTLMEDSLQMANESDNLISSGAVAFVSNYTTNQSFELETDLLFTQISADVDRVALLALGEHKSDEDPFEPDLSDEYYSLGLFPALPTSQVNLLFPAIEPDEDGNTPVLFISQGLDGPYLAAARWGGRKPLAPPQGEIIFEEDFEDPGTDSEWLTGGDNGVWEIGESTYEPAGVVPERAGRVAGTDLDSEVPELTNDWLRSPVIDLTGVEQASISFFEALRIDPVEDEETGDFFQSATVSVVDVNGMLIRELAHYTGDSGEEWRQRSFELPADVLGQQVRIEFHIVTDNFAPDGNYGWLIDDVTVTKIIPAETLQELYTLNAQGEYGFSGELELTVTLTDAGDTHSQSLSATVLDPVEGNLFGLGGRLHTTDTGSPLIDFQNLSMTLGEQTDVVPTTLDSSFYYAFGTEVPRVSPDANFALYGEANWTLRESGLELDTEGSAQSVALTRVLEFEEGKSINVNTEVTLASLNAGVGGSAGLALFGEADPDLFAVSDPSSYYSLHYTFDGIGNGKLVLREGTSGTILNETPFLAPVEGTTYRLEFDGSYNESGQIEYTANITDGAGEEAILEGTLAASLGERNRFGIGAAQGGGDVWEFASFGGYVIGEMGANYSLYRWTPTSRRGGGTGDVQLAEFTFYHEGVDILAERRANGEDLPTVSGLAPVENQAPAQAIDGNTTDADSKWFAGPGFPDLTFAFGEPTRIDGYMIWTANDFESRDPTGWTLEGSHDGFNWVELDRVDGFEAPTDRFARYKAEDEFVLPTGVQLNSFTIASVDGEAINGDYAIAAAGSPVTLSWDVSFFTNVTISPDVGVVGGSGTVEVVPASLGDVTYTLTAVGPDGVQETATVTVTAVEAGSQTYRYVRFDIPDEAALRGLNANSIQLSQFLFFNDGEEVLPVEVTNPNGANPDNGTQNPPNLLSTAPADAKWLDFNKVTMRDGITYTEGSYLVFDFGIPVTLDAYRFRTANDATERDPMRWRLWGRDSSDEPWTLFEQMNTPYPTPTERNAYTQIFPLQPGSLPSPGVVQRLAITEVDGEAVDARRWVIVMDGEPITVTWEAATGNNVTLSPGPGAVATSGTQTFLPPQGVTSTITLTASGDGGAAASTLLVRSVPVGHFVTYRYIRFDIPDNSALRNPNENSIQLSRFFFYRNGVRLDPNDVEVTNPNGDNPETQGPDMLTGDWPDDKWLDFNRANLNDSHLVWDFGSPVEIDSYQMGTAGDAPGRDPLRWNLYGRNSPDEEWTMIENMDFEYLDMPTARSDDPEASLTPIIPLPGSAMHRLVIEGLTFSDWLDTHFEGDDRTNPDVSGPMADPAGDGVANLLKYAFGLDPWTPVSGADLPQAELVDDKLRLTYPERVGATDILYRPEKSFTLEGWNADGIQEVGPREPFGNGDFEWVTVEIDLNDEAKAFLRVNVMEVE